jgi:hypothetical protein
VTTSVGHDEHAPRKRLLIVVPKRAEPPITLDSDHRVLGSKDASEEGELRLAFIARDPESDLPPRHQVVRSWVVDAPSVTEGVRHLDQSGLEANFPVTPANYEREDERCEGLGAQTLQATIVTG